MDLSLNSRNQFFNDRKPEQEGSYSCTICDKVFTLPARLVRHYRTHTGERPFTCEFCNKTFSVKENLAVHRRIHTNERPYKCHLCNRAFEHSGKLHRHVRIHTGERPHKCEVCGKTFIQSGQLVIHRRTHTGEKPYVCKICSKGFTCSKQLKVHMRSHTGEKPYVCSYCGKAFGYNHVLKLHQVSHFGSKIYKCALCDETFKTKKAMESHILKHDSNLNEEEFRPISVSKNVGKTKGFFTQKFPTSQRGSSTSPHSNEDLASNPAFADEDDSDGNQNQETKCSSEDESSRNGKISCVPLYLLKDKYHNFQSDPNEFEPPALPLRKVVPNIPDLIPLEQTDILGAPNATPHMGETRSSNESLMPVKLEQRDLTTPHSHAIDMRKDLEYFKRQAYYMEQKIMREESKKIMYLQEYYAQHWNPIGDSNRHLAPGYARIPPPPLLSSYPKAYQENQLNLPFRKRRLLDPLHQGYTRMF